MHLHGAVALCAGGNCRSGFRAAGRADRRQHLARQYMWVPA
jgi:hypothetical protein